MKQRIITAVIALLALLLVLFVVPEPVALVVIVAVMLTGAWEWSAFLGFTARTGRLVYVATIAALLAAVSFLSVDVSLILQVAMLWWGIALIWALPPTLETEIPAWIAGLVLALNKSVTR